MGVVQSGGYGMDRLTVGVADEGDGLAGAPAQEGRLAALGDASGVVFVGGAGECLRFFGSES